MELLESDANVRLVEKVTKHDAACLASVSSKEHDGEQILEKINTINHSPVAFLASLEALDNTSCYIILWLTNCPSFRDLAGTSPSSV